MPQNTILADYLLGWSKNRGKWLRGQLHDNSTVKEKSSTKSTNWPMLPSHALLVKTEDYPSKLEEIIWKSVIGSNIHDIEMWIFHSLWIVFVSRERNHVTKASRWEVEESWSFNKNDPKWVKNSHFNRGNHFIFNSVSQWAWEPAFSFLIYTVYTASVTVIQEKISFTTFHRSTALNHQ